MKRKLISGVLALGLAVALLPGLTLQARAAEWLPVVAQPFSDVTAGGDCYYYDGVAWALRNGITAGVDPTHFGPNESCTRGQVMVFLWRAAGSPTPQAGQSPFADVADPTAYYYQAVLWAWQQGIAGGVGDNQFAPEQTVTRGEFVTFLWRAAGHPGHGTGNPFGDVSSGDYYYDGVLWAYEKGVTTGTDEGHFSPRDTCIRAQTITFLYRYYAGQFEKEIRQLLTAHTWECSVQTLETATFSANGTGVLASGFPGDQGFYGLAYSIEGTTVYITSEDGEGRMMEWQWVPGYQYFEYSFESIGEIETIQVKPFTNG